MTAQEFAYWLQGYAELNGKAPDEEQWGVIRDHLGLVFQKVTPPFRAVGERGVVLAPATRGISPFDVFC